MTKLTDIMNERMALSFEVFPPKTEKGMENLPGSSEHLCKYQPDYISCTYGAGGGNVGANREVCQMIKNAGTTPVTHFTVIKNTKEGMKDQLQQYLNEGVDLVLPLIIKKKILLYYTQHDNTGTVRGRLLNRKVEIHIHRHVQQCFL